MPSDEAPFQAFRWTHRPENLIVGPYEYTVSAMYFHQSGTLRRGPTVAVQAELGPFVSGRLEVGFTRGWSSPESYLRQFGRTTFRPAGERSLDYDTTSYQPQYEWLGWHARKLVFDLLTECVKDNSITVDMFAYDFDEPDILKMCEALGSRLRIFLDNSPLHAGTALEVRVHDRLVKSAGADNVKQGHFQRFAHAKIIIQKKDGKAVKVLTGSANFSVRGLNVQTNNVLVFDDATTADLYEQAFNQAFCDPSKNQSAFAKSSIARGWFDVTRPGLPVCSVAFSPHASPEVSLSRIAQHISEAESSVFFVVLDLEPGGPVMDALKELPSRPGIFSYGITEGVDSRKRTASGTVISYSPGVRSTPPALFAGSPGAGMLVQLKCVVVDFNDAQPVVITGSSNFSTGEKFNGDNLLVIYDRSVATAYAIEAIRMVDHYQFVAALRTATTVHPLRLQKFGEGPQWWKPYYEPGNVKRRERLLFTR